MLVISFYVLYILSKHLVRFFSRGRNNFFSKPTAWEAYYNEGFRHLYIDCRTSIMYTCSISVSVKMDQSGYLFKYCEFFLSNQCLSSHNGHMNNFKLAKSMHSGDKMFLKSSQKFHEIFLKLDQISIMKALEFLPGSSVQVSGMVA